MKNEACNFLHVHMKEFVPNRPICSHIESVLSLFISGTLSVMWRLVEFTWSWNGFQRLRNQMGWIRLVCSQLKNHLIASFSLIIIIIIILILIFSVASGPSVLLQTILPEQDSTFSRSPVCVCRTSRWLTSESLSNVLVNNWLNGQLD